MSTSEQVFEIIKDQYEAIMRDYGFYKNRHITERETRTWKSLQKATACCMEIKADPVLYVQAMFEYFKKYGKAKYFAATYLHMHDYKAIYDQFITEAAQTAKVDWEDIFQAQLRYLETALIQTNRTVEQILLDDGINFAPWFRIIITKDPIPSIMEKYQNKAKQLVTADLLQFLQSKKLDIKRLI